MISPYLSQNAPPCLRGAKSEARNPEKSLSEFKNREGEKVKIEKERGLANQGLFVSGSGGCSQNDYF
jgi:hypothetical protein